MNLQMKRYPSCSLQQDVSEYVADLQLHMTLQARNLVPSLNQAQNQGPDSREQMLQQTQAHFEKLISRQSISL